MERLTAIISVICLLQGVLADPRPDYGLIPPITNGDKINTAIGLVGTAAITIESISMPTTIVSGYTNLVTTLNVLFTVEGNFTEFTNAIASNYTNLYAATDGLIANDFGPVLSAIGDVIDYIGDEDTEAATVTILQGIQYTGIANELADEFTRLKNGLKDLQTKFQAMQDALTAAVLANNGSPDVPAATLSQYFTPAKLYALVSSINTVKAYMPVINYTLQTAFDNIATADAYIVGLQQALSSVGPSVSQEITADLTPIINEIESKVTAGVTVGLVGEVNNITTAVQGMTSLSATTNYSNLISTLSGLAGINKTADDATLAGLLTNIITAATALLNSKVAGYNALTNPAVTALIDTLVGNDQYGQYCYYKYKDLVSGLFDQGSSSTSQCLDVEVQRLTHLLHTLLMIFELIHFDIEDVVAQVQVCAALSDSDTQDDCVTQLNTYYGALFTQTVIKVGLVYSLAEAEAVASMNRLLICFELANLNSGVASVDDIALDIGFCATEGPAGANE